MNAIVVDASAQEPLPRYRRKMKRFVKKHPAAGWGYDPFAGFCDLVPSIQIAEGSTGTTIIEIIAHGSPTYLQDIGKGTLETFAAVLRTLFTNPATSEVYLTGCNTGLADAGYCIAEELARALEEVTVYGAAGYVTRGAAASQDAETRMTDGEPAYPGSRDDVHPTCWNHFHFPPPPPGAARPVQVKPTPEIDPEKLRDAIAEALRIERPREMSPLLIGPDVKGTIVFPEGPFAYEILARGAILRNAVSRQMYDFPRGVELLERWLTVPR